MKTDRILETIIYLINHDNVSASYLAELFNVSVRTIQRDMLSISSIGIPVYANGGKNGGYSILETFKMKNINIKNEEQQIIVKALESLATSYSSDTLKPLIEKDNAIIDREGGQKIFWDFSVTKENADVQTMNTMLEKAIEDKKYITFDYCNGNGEKSKPQVEPLAIHYKWYAWYLFTYSDKGVSQKEYKTFKVARMSNLEVEKRSSKMNHGDIQQLMKDSENNYYKTCIHIEVHFHEQEAELMKEYFPDCPFEILEDGLCRIFIDVPAKERLWKALLLSFGNRVKVIGPENYRDELIQTATNFLSNYDI